MIAKLMVADMARSLDFYCRGLGFELQFAVSPARQVVYGRDARGAVLCSLAAGRTQLMLQTADSLAEELPGEAPERPLAGTFSLYFSGLAPERALERLGPAARRVKGPETTWYGMRELHLRDPDGYVICVAAPDPERAAALAAA